MLGIATILPPEGRRILTEGYKKCKKEKTAEGRMNVLDKHILATRQKFPKFFLLTDEQRNEMQLRKERADLNERIATAIHMLRRGFTLAVAAQGVGISQDLIVAVLARRNLSVQ